MHVSDGRVFGQNHRRDSTSRGSATNGWVELGSELVAQFAHLVGVKSSAQKFPALDQLGEVAEEAAEQTGRIRLGGSDDTDQLGTALRTEDRRNAHRGAGVERAQG